MVFVPVYEENGFNVTSEDLEKVITDKTKAIILNTPNNPTGAIMSKEEVDKISKLIIEKDLILISDEVYEALLFEDKHYSFGAVEGMKERIYIAAGFFQDLCHDGMENRLCDLPGQECCQYNENHQHRIHNGCQYFGSKGCPSCNEALQRGYSHDGGKI